MGYLRKSLNAAAAIRRARARGARLKSYVRNGRVPWSVGYVDFKEDAIRTVLADPALVSRIGTGDLPPGHGVGLDERIVEYPWIFSQLREGATRCLDAGSTFNYEHLVAHPALASKDLTIFTYSPEDRAYFERRISYVYGDLRDLPFRDAWFDEIVCQSTIEHIDMDNSLYGYAIENGAASGEKSYQYMQAIAHLARVLRPGGTLLLTFPYGRFENHGFFQQLDAEMTARVTAHLDEHGSARQRFFRYLPQGWRSATQDECADARSFNPHTGAGRGEDNAAHSRAICCVRFDRRE